MKNKLLSQRWSTKTLDEVAEFINGKAFKPKDWSKTGLPIIRIQNLTDKSKPFNYFDGDFDNRYLVQNEDILISWSASIGIFIWKRGDAVLNQHIFKVILKENIDKKFFVYAVSRKINEMKHYSHGSTMKHITRGQFLKTSIPIPSLAVQKHISNILSKSDDLNHKRMQIMTRVNHLIHSILVHFFDDKITRGELSLVPLEGIAHIADVDHKMPKEVTHGIPLISTKDFTDDGKINFTKAKLISENDYERMSKRVNIKFGDILFSRYGTLGKCVRIETDKKFTISYSLVLISPNQNRVNPTFLFYLFKSKYLERQIKEETRTTGVPDIGIKSIRGFKIPLPSLVLQEDFSMMVQKIESVRTRLEEIQTKEHILRNSLESKLFSGELINQ